MNKILEIFGGTSKAVDLLVKLVFAAIVFFMLRKLYIQFLRRNSGKAEVNKANLDGNKNYDNIAKSVFDTFDIFLTSTSETSDLCSQLMQLNDDEIKQVNNRYVVLYGKGVKTLQDAVEGAFWGPPNSSSPCGLLLGRMVAINLN